MGKAEEHFMSNFNEIYDMKKQPPKERCDWVPLWNFIEKKLSGVASFKARAAMLPFPGNFLYDGAIRQV